MLSGNLLKTAALNTVAMAVGALIAASCVNVQYPTVAFRCNPRQTDNCPDGYVCCSDDPSRLSGALLFAGFNNSLSAKGMCVEDGAIPLGSGLMEKPECPVPCNPLWDSTQVMNVCGGTRVCCQTVEITELDCILIGDSWTPVEGDDILASRTDWGVATHETHQDPGGTVCLDLADERLDGIPGDQNSDLFKDCARRLSVANQRGFCMQLGPGQGCPTAGPGYIDACNQRNQIENRPFHGEIPPGS